MTDTDCLFTEVFLTGDSSPLACTMTVEQILALVADIPAGHAHDAWVRLALVEGGDALVRPLSITALVPAADDDDD